MSSIAGLSLGNDIVDLQCIEPKLHPRFIERVFTAQEQSEVGNQLNLIWLYWSAKEAAFKALKRLNPALIFSPRAFLLDRLKQEIYFEDFVLYCRQELTTQFAYTVAATDQRVFASDQLLDWYSSMDNSDSHEPSLWLRQAAVVRVSQLLRICPTELSISPSGLGAPSSGGKIPVLLKSGIPSHDLLSLSHHGRFGAFTFVSIPLGG